MDITSLFAALTAADRENKASAEADNPFAPMVGASNAVGQALLHAAPDYWRKGSGGGIGDTIVAGLLAGGMGGIGENLGKTYVDDSITKQNDLTSQVLKSALSGGDMTMPEGMNPSVFSNIKNIGSVYRTAQQDENQAISMKSINDLLKNQGSVMVNGKVIQIYDPAAEAARQAGLVKQAEVQNAGTNDLLVPGVGIANTSDDAKSLKLAKEAFDPIFNSLNELKAIRARSGVESFDSNDRVRARDLASQILLAIKSPAIGALGQLGPKDTEVVESMLPKDPLGTSYPFYEGGSNAERAVNQIAGDRVMTQLDATEKYLKDKYQTAINTRLKPGANVPDVGAAPPSAHPDSFQGKDGTTYEIIKNANGDPIAKRPIQ